MNVKEKRHHKIERHEEISKKKNKLVVQSIRNYILELNFEIFF